MKRWKLAPAQDHKPTALQRSLQAARDLPDLGVVVSANAHGITVWRREDLSPLARMAPTGPDSAIPHNWRLAVGADGSMVWLDQGQVWRLGPAMSTAFCHPVELPFVPDALALSNDGEHLALYRKGQDGEVGMVNLFSGKALWSKEAQIDWASFAPAGQLLLWEHTWSVQSGSDTLSFEVAETASGKTRLAHSQSCWDESAWWRADGQAVLVGSSQKRPDDEHPIKGATKAPLPQRAGTDPPHPPAPQNNLWGTIKTTATQIQGKAVGAVFEKLARGQGTCATSNPHLHPDIVGYYRLRDQLNEWCSQRQGMEFADERNWLSDEERLRLQLLDEAIPGGFDRVRHELNRLQEESPELLHAAQSFWAEVWRKKAQEQPDVHTADLAQRWQQVVDGERNDIIFHL